MMRSINNFVQKNKAILCFIAETTPLSNPFFVYLTWINLKNICKVCKHTVLPGLTNVQGNKKMSKICRVFAVQLQLDKVGKPSLESERRRGNLKNELNTWWPRKKSNFVSEPSLAKIEEKRACIHSTENEFVVTLTEEKKSFAIDRRETRENYRATTLGFLMTSKLHKSWNWAANSSKKRIETSAPHNATFIISAQAGIISRACIKEAWHDLLFSRKEVGGCV